MHIDNSLLLHDFLFSKFSLSSTQHEIIKLSIFLRIAIGIRLDILMSVPLILRIFLMALILNVDLILKCDLILVLLFFKSFVKLIFLFKNSGYIVSDLGLGCYV